MSGKFDRLAISFDTDWVPQFVLDYVLEKLADRGLGATVFCTNRYELPNAPEIEAALHPNFMQDSTQGNSEREVVEQLRVWWPEAVGSRSHRLFWHSGLRPLLLQNGIRYDSSYKLTLHPTLRPVQDNGLWRLPFWWSDNFHLSAGLPLDRFDMPELRKAGMKILLFHPIHVYLNTRNRGEFRADLRKIGSLPDCTEEKLLKLRRPGVGLGTTYEAALDYVREVQHHSPSLKELIGEST